ncbi:DoxX-like family protein [Portibacter marinus]|uniref:DoxX-like family protein n=1 Tax=Portibacter marinus TaxID=2898660 RepID=UPI001F24E567|nr:DoxX-like family protein [Portibacter marinus]
MNENQGINRILTIFISVVWLLNGLVCKVLNLVPRHQQIVAEILGQEHPRLLTILIGLSEVVMAFWVISKYKSKINAVVQIVLVASMNFLELLLVPELLMWGKMNSLFAIVFVIVVKCPHKVGPFS